MRLKDMTQGEMNIINGGDEILLPALAAGADAGIGATYNIMLPEFVSIYNDFKAGKLECARATQLKVNRVIMTLIRHQVIPSVKCGLKLMGFDVGAATYPMKQLTKEEEEAFKAAMTSVGWPFN